MSGDRIPVAPFCILSKMKYVNCSVLRNIPSFGYARRGFKGLWVFAYQSLEKSGQDIVSRDAVGEVRINGLGFRSQPEVQDLVFQGTLHVAFAGTTREPDKCQNASCPPEVASLSFFALVVFDASKSGR